MQERWLLLAWAVVTAALPWWLGFPLLLSIAALAVLLQHRLDEGNPHDLRRVLRWGLVGLLVAVFRACGGDALAAVTALLAALAGFTLLAGLDAWLDRDRRRSPESLPEAEWPDLARRPVGPPARLVELIPPQWHTSPEAWADASGHRVVFQHDGFDLGDGGRVDGVAAEAAFSPGGRWFAARLPDDAGVVLWDGQRHRQRRLRGWQLCGWHDDQPWLSRHDDDPPQALSGTFEARSAD